MTTENNPNLERKAKSIIDLANNHEVFKNCSFISIDNRIAISIASHKIDLKEDISEDLLAIDSTLYGILEELKKINAQIYFKH